MHASVTLLDILQSLEQLSFNGSHYHKDLALNIQFTPKQKFLYNQLTAAGAKKAMQRKLLGSLEPFRVREQPRRRSQEDILTLAIPTELAFSSGMPWFVLSPRSQMP